MCKVDVSHDLFRRGIASPLAAKEYDGGIDDDQCFVRALARNCGIVDNSTRDVWISRTASSQYATICFASSVGSEVESLKTLRASRVNILSTNQRGTTSDWCA
jgi:hypothetical protein